jgi:hypothetical protein
MKWMHSKTYHYQENSMYNLAECQDTHLRAKTNTNIYRTHHNHKTHGTGKAE